MLTGGDADQRPTIWYFSPVCFQQYSTLVPNPVAEASNSVGVLYLKPLEYLRNYNGYPCVLVAYPL